MLTHERLVALLNYDPDTGEFRWKVARGGSPVGNLAGTIQTSGYRQIRVDGVLYVAHRLAWYYVYRRWPRDQIDHCNRIRDDNRLENLREATNGQNRANSREFNQTGFKGVARNYNKWQAQIRVNGKHIYLGNYASKEAAHEAYCIAARKHFGEFARVE